MERVLEVKNRIVMGFLSKDRKLGLGVTIAICIKHTRQVGLGLTSYILRYLEKRNWSTDLKITS
jgi:hypothetical protein